MNMACVMVLSRIRTLDEYGTYSQLLMAVNLVSMLLILGLPNSINYFLAREETNEGRRSYLNNYFTLNLLLSGAAGLVLFFGTPVLEWYFHNEEISTYSFFLLLYPFASITMSATESLLVVYERPRTLVLYRLLNSLSLLGILIIIDALGMSFRQYMVLFLATELCFAFAVYAIASRLAGGLRLAFSAKKLRDIAAFCVPIGLASAVGTLSAELDKLVISAFFTTSEYAIYTNAAKELPLSVLASATTTVVMPKVVQYLHRGENERAVRLWKDAFALNYSVMAVMVFGIVTFAPEVITILYSEKYLPGVTVFRIYTLLLLLRCTYFGMMLNAMGKTKYILRVSILALCLNVVLNIACYYVFGFTGPAIATVLECVASAMIYVLLTSKHLSISITYLLPIKTLSLITLVNMLFSFAFYGLKKILPLEHIVQAGTLGSDRMPVESVGQCTESVFLGIIWCLLYFLVMYRFMRKKWDQLNKTGAED